MSFSAANYTLSGGSLTLQGSTGPAAVTVSGGAQSIDSALILASSVNIAGEGNISFGGVISGSGGLIVNGPGGVTLSNFNTYTGGTTVNGGTLNLEAGGETGAIRGVLTINPGATVELAGNSLGYYNPVIPLPFPR